MEEEIERKLVAMALEFTSLPRAIINEVLGYYDVVQESLNMELRNGITDFSSRNLDGLDFFQVPLPENTTLDFRNSQLSNMDITKFKFNSINLRLQGATFEDMTVSHALVDGGRDIYEQDEWEDEPFSLLNVARWARECGIDDRYYYTQGERGLRLGEEFFNANVWGLDFYGEWEGEKEEEAMQKYLEKQIEEGAEEKINRELRDQAEQEEEEEAYLAYQIEQYEQMKREEREEKLIAPGPRSGAMFHPSSNNDRDRSADLGEPKRKRQKTGKEEADPNLDKSPHNSP